MRALAAAAAALLLGSTAALVIREPRDTKVLDRITTSGTPAR